MGLAICSGLIASPDRGEPFPGDILIERGRISRIGRVNPKGHVACDASGLLVMPSFCDLHVHFREPGFTFKEDIRSGAAAALAGGFACAVMMPNVLPPPDCFERAADVLERARGVAVRLELAGAMTAGREGKVPADYASLSRLVRFVSDDGNAVESQAVFRECAILARKHSLVLFAHAEPEPAMVERDIAVCAETGTRYHVTHVSRAETVDIVSWARQRGLPVTADATVHHLCLTRHDVPVRDGGADPDYKTNPPLGDNEDRDALVEAVRDGTIDAVTTDHAPHEPEAKREYATASPGAIGLETAAPAIYTHLVRTGRLTEARMAEAMSSTPSGLLGHPVTLAEGAEAHIVALDILQPAAVVPDNFKSKSRNCPFKGTHLYGWPVMAVIRTELWRRMKPGGNDWEFQDIQD